MEETYNENVVIAKWFKKNHQPDYDGYCGTFILPEEIMDEYIKLFPKDWDVNEGIMIFIPDFIKRMFKIGRFASTRTDE